MRRSSLAAAVYLVLVFASGIVVGAFGYRLYTGSSVNATSRRKGPEEYKRHYLAEMQSRLRLNEDQVARLSAILDETREQYRVFRDTHKSEMQAIQDGQVRRVKELLSPEQQAEYEKMREERHKRRQQGKE
ncbi:MAG: hypothetical protein IT158_08200 [Bryobacterales bacterium]|nr:hypothetical protein [Bryobacterales bacterium]